MIVTEFQAAEAYSGLDLTKTKYSISRLSMAENENVCELILIISSYVKKENQYDENEVYNQYIQPAP